MKGAFEDERITDHRPEKVVRQRAERHPRSGWRQSLGGARGVRGGGGDLRQR